MSVRKVVLIRSIEEEFRLVNAQLGRRRTERICNVVVLNGRN